MTACASCKPLTSVNVTAGVGGVTNAGTIRYTAPRAGFDQHARALLAAWSRHETPKTLTVHSGHVLAVET